MCKVKFRQVPILQFDNLLLFEETPTEFPNTKLLRHILHRRFSQYSDVVVILLGLTELSQD